MQLKADSNSLSTDYYKWPSLYSVGYTHFINDRKTV